MPTLKRTRDELHALRRDKYPSGTPIRITKMCAVFDHHNIRREAGEILDGFLIYSAGTYVPGFAWEKSARNWVYRASVASWDFKKLKVGRFVP